MAARDKQETGAELRRVASGSRGVTPATSPRRSAATPRRQARPTCSCRVVRVGREKGVFLLQA